MTTTQKISESLYYSFVGIMSFICCIIFATYYYNDHTHIFIQKIFSYDMLIKIIIALFFAIGMLYASEPLTKILLKNPSVNQWYINFKAKQMEKHRK